MKIMKFYSTGLNYSKDLCISKMKLKIFLILLEIGTLFSTIVLIEK